MMNNKQAKDFLVEQTAQQAALENIPLSDLEKRMMYFTESDPSYDDYIGLTAEFEEQYDTAEYEAKIARLLRNAHRRLKKENAETARVWKASFRKLREGDHYLLVLWSAAPLRDHPTRDVFKHVGIGVLIAVLLFIGMIITEAIRAK
jgi:hypothetical protein